MNKIIVKDLDYCVFDYATPRINDDGEEMHLYTQTIYLGKNDSAENYIEVDRFKTYYAPEGFIYQETNQGVVIIDLFTDNINNYTLKEAQENVSN